MDCEQLCTTYSDGKWHTPSKDCNYSAMEPWVKIKIGGYTISTGNAPPEAVTTACILSMDYGAVGIDGNGGFSFKTTIIDEEGSNLHLFITKLFACMVKAKEYYQFKAQWGWKGRKCPEENQGEQPTSPEITCSIFDIQIIFAEGKVKYEITAGDITQASQATKVNENYGKKDKKMTLKKAIEKMSSESDPKWDVEFKNFDDSDCLFDPVGGIDGEDGPKGVWEGKQATKLQAISDWLGKYLSQNKRKFILIWDQTSKTPKLRISSEPAESQKMNLGTFIVNGGPCSVVTQFSTTFSYLQALLTFNSGGSLNPSTGEAKKEKREYSDQKEAECQKNVGVSNVIISDQNAESNYPEEEIGERIAEAQNLNVQRTTGLAGIEAELKIIGNPREEFVFPAFKQIFHCAVIVINPFTLEKRSEDCPMWTHSSSCNEVLSNKQWIVKGIQHQISNGNYSTIIKLVLNAPGVNVELSKYNIKTNG